MFEHKGFVIKPVGDRYQVFLPCGSVQRLVLDGRSFKSVLDATRYIDAALDVLENLLL